MSTHVLSILTTRVACKGLQTPAECAPLCCGSRPSWTQPLVQNLMFVFTGVLEDGALAKQTPGSFRRMAAGKVAGLAALERHLGALPVPGLAAFSSVSSIVAPLGQPNYAAANASLPAWASAKAGQGETLSYSSEVCVKLQQSQLCGRKRVAVRLASAKAAQSETLGL